MDIYQNHLNLRNVLKGKILLPGTKIKIGLGFPSCDNSKY